MIDAAYLPRILEPTYPAGAGPVVLVDAGHNTFHARDEHFGQLAEILLQDGYRVAALRDQYSARALAGADLLIVVNALADLGRAFGMEFMNGFAIVEAEWDPLVFRRSRSTLRAHPITDGRLAGERVDSAVTFVAGHAFRATDERACPLLIFGAGVVSINMERAWKFDDATPRVPVDGWLQGAAVEVGGGRVAIFGEAAMFAAQLVGTRRQPVGMNAPVANQNLQLLLNTLRWLSRAPGLEATASEERPPFCPGNEDS